MVDPFSLTLAILALLISGITAWFTLFHKGTVQMTQPTVIFLGPENPGAPDEALQNKVFIRTLLFATSKRGRIIENMYVTLRGVEGEQAFGIWVYGEHSKLVRGSGLFVGETGVEANHHFLPHDAGEDFRFTSGSYDLEIFAHLLGDKERKSLFTQTVVISPENATALQNNWAGLYFDWVAESTTYVPHIDIKPFVIPPLKNE